MVELRAAPPCGDYAIGHFDAAEHLHIYRAFRSFPSIEYRWVDDGKCGQEFAVGVRRWPEMSHEFVDWFMRVCGRRYLMDQRVVYAKIFGIN